MNRFQAGSIFLLLQAVLVSCKQDRNINLMESSLTTPESTRSGDQDSSKKKTQDLYTELALHIPISNEELKKWIPEKVGEMEQSKIIVGHKQGIGMSGAISTYEEIEKSGKMVSMEVLDGAGATGSVMIRSVEQKLMPDYEEKKFNGYSKIYEREGVRVWEKLNSQEDFAEIEFICNSRYHFIFKGYQFQPEELWVFVKKVKAQMI